MTTPVYKLALGYPVGRHQARTLMRQLGLRVLPTRRFKVTTDSKHDLPVAQNVLAREFDVEAPDRVWAGDITYLWTQQGWLYLAVIIDLYSRKVVGCSIKQRMTTDLVQDSLTCGLASSTKPRLDSSHGSREPVRECDLSERVAEA